MYSVRTTADYGLCEMFEVVQSSISEATTAFSDIQDMDNKVVSAELLSKILGYHMLSRNGYWMSLLILISRIPTPVSIGNLRQTIVLIDTNRFSLTFSLTRYM